MKTARKYRPGVEIGDRVYFRCAEDGPRSGSVVSRGKHGCTIDCEGGQHRVRWGDLLGHKERTNLRYTILDEGEDGVIVEDERGQRRYLSIPPGQREDPLVMKAFDGRYLFLKAKGTEFMGRPGLSKKRITDKLGRSTTRWVRTQQDEPTQRKQAAADDGARTSRAGADQPRSEYKAGQRVSFRLGGTSGEGEIIGTPGADGAHVRDESGKVHQVTYERMSQAALERRESASVAGGADNQPETAEDIARALFNTSELAKLPSKATQPVDSWEDLSRLAPEALDQFKSLLGKVAGNLGLVLGKRPQSYKFAQQAENAEAEKEGRKARPLDESLYMSAEDWDNDKGFLFMGPIKGEKRAREKVESDYHGDWSQVRDMVRATIAVASVTQLPKVLKSLEHAGMKLAQKPKNNLIKPLPGGYRDINMIVEMPNGMLAELQLHVKPMTLAKEKGHAAYEVSRAIEARYQAKGVKDKDQWRKGDLDLHGAAMKEQEAIYNPAWKKATQGLLNLAKSMVSGIVLLWKSRGQNGTQC